MSWKQGVRMTRALAWSCAFAFAVASVHSNAALVGHWTMDEASVTTLNDSSGHGNHATLVGSTARVDGVFGKALLLDGSAYASVALPADVPVGNAPRSVSAWIKVTGTTGDFFQDVLAYGSPGAANQAFLFERGRDGAPWTHKLTVDSWGSSTTGTTPLEIGTWHHVAATFDGTTLRLYVDGIEETSVARSYATVLNATGLVIGDAPANDGNHGRFVGAIDDLRLYDHALTAPEVQSLRGLVAWWKADGDATDSVGAHHGTLVNGATFAAGPNGQAFSLDGADDLVRVADAPDLSFAPASPVTIMLWVNPAGVATTHILGKRGTCFDQGQSIHYLFAQSGASDLTFVTGAPTGALRIDASNVLVTNQWQHLAVTADGTTLRLYRGGVLVGSTPGVLGAQNNGAALEIGGSGFACSTFPGLIDDVRIYGRLVTEAELAAAASVTRVASSVAVTSSSNPVTEGLPVTLTATVTGNAASGTATFSDGVTVLCSDVPLAVSQAQCTTTALAVGSHAITVAYSGDVFNLPSTSTQFHQMVTAFNPVIDVCATCTFTSIQSAVNSIPVGYAATVRVAQGTYAENVVVNMSKQVVLQGGWDASFSTRSGDPALTTITSPSYGITAARAGAGQTISLTVTGFRLTGAGSGGYDIGGGVSASAIGGGVVTVNVDNCLITGNGGSNAHGAGAGATATGTGSVVNLNVNRTRIVGNAVTFYYGGAMYLGADTSGTINAQVTNTLIVNNSAMYGGGIYVVANAFDCCGGSINPGVVNLTLLNSTISNNLAWQYSYYGGGTGGGLLVNGLIGAVTLDIKNSITYGNNATDATTRDVYLDRMAGGTLNLNAIYSDIGVVFNEATDPATVTLGAGVISADPLFVSAAGGDYRPSANSPAVDTGTASGAPAVDLDGNARPIGSGIDMGAFEIDGVPNALSFTDQSDVPVVTLIESNAVAVSGVTVPAAIYVVGGEFAISTDGGLNWSAWSSVAATVGNGHLIKLRVPSSENYLSTTSATVTVGGVAATFTVKTVSGTLDINLDGAYEAATDGVLQLRYLFGFTGNALTDGALGGSSPQRTDPAEIATYLGRLRSQLDVDGDGVTLPLTDGLLVLRHLLGLRGEALTAHALGVGVTRSAAEIGDAIQLMRP